MEPRLDILTLAVPDLDTVRRFYCDGLGWTPTLDVPGDVLFFRLNHGLLVAFWGAENLAADVGADREAVTPGAGFALAHNVDSPDTVREVLERARRAGATILKPAQQAAFGGVHGYFADPVGIRWEVAYNPGWRVAPDGDVTLT